MPDAPSEMRSAPSTAKSLPKSGSYPIDQTLSFQSQPTAGPRFAPGDAQIGLGMSTWALIPGSYSGAYVPHISRHALGESIRMGIAAFDGEGTEYQRSDQSGLLGRAQHAFLETFTSQMPGGTRIPALSRFAGAYGAAFLTNTWYADPRASFALQRGSLALGSSLGLNLVQELVPQKYLKALHVPGAQDRKPR